MPRTLLGTGGTNLERMTQNILDKIAPGSSSLPSGFFNGPNASTTFNQFSEENIYHPSGVLLAMTGFTEVGGPDVVSK